MNIPFLKNKQRKEEERLQQFDKLLDERAAQLANIEQEIKLLESKRETTRLEIIETGHMAFAQEKKLIEDNLQKEEEESQKKAIQLVNNAKIEAKNILDEANSQIESVKKEYNNIIDAANIEAKKIIEQANIQKNSAEKEAQTILEKAQCEARNTILANEESFLIRVRQARQEAKEKEEEGIAMFKEWSERTLQIIERAYKDKEEILNGLSDYDLFLFADKNELTTDKIEYYITQNEDISFKNDLGMIDRRIKFLKEEKSAIYAETPTQITNIRLLAIKPIEQLCLAHFDMVVDNIIKSSFKYGIESSISKIWTLKKRIENAFADFKLYISPKYLELKINQLRTKYAYEEYKSRKKEELAQQRELKREEEKAQREYERSIQQAEKDEEKARRMIEETQLKLQEETINEKRYNELQQKIEQLNAALEEAIQRGERAKSMAEQTRRGYVYVISNIGSFGENVFKIGLTRRLDPTERIDELSNASVPFPFDIHAIIESEDAPALESALHKAFDTYKLNKTNWRKEFFKVSLSEIELMVANSGIQATFIKEFPARQYRDSLFAEHCEQKR